MIYLTTPPARDRWAELAAAGVGVMRTPAAGVQLDLVRAFPAFACDNGCYTAGARFDLDAYLSWLDAMRPAQATCLFATAPDVVGDAGATWERSRPVLPLIRALGYPAALVAQDGWDNVAVDWGAFDVLFIGGTDHFKFSEQARELILEARQRRTWVHVGRVNSWARCSWAHAAGAHSADGTTVAFNSVRYVPEVCRWARRLSSQQRLWAVPA